MEHEKSELDKIQNQNQWITWSNTTNWNEEQGLNQHYHPEIHWRYARGSKFECTYVKS
jgi:hypothetical protein